MPVNMNVGIGNLGLWLDKVSSLMRRGHVPRRYFFLSFSHATQPAQHNGGIQQCSQEASEGRHAGIQELIAKMNHAAMTEKSLTE